MTSSATSYYGGASDDRCVFFSIAFLEYMHLTKSGCVARLAFSIGAWCRRAKFKGETCPTAFMDNKKSEIKLVSAMGSPARAMNT
jgi:hypothetical protein